MTKHTMIVVEDEEGVRASIRSFFSKGGYGVLEADGVGAAKKVLDGSRSDVAIVDYLLPDGDGIELLRTLSPVQPKLLKVLEEQRFRRLGGVRDHQISVHLIAASHQDLEGLVREEKFRSDLFYRINTIPLHVPPLRRRKRDVVLLARTILDRIAADLGRPRSCLTEEAERALEAYSWPGNIRELRNVLERAALLRGRATVEVEDIPRSLSTVSPGRDRCQLTLREVERRHIEEALCEQGDVPRAASVLGLSRSALY